MAKLTKIEAKPLMGLYLSMMDLKKTQNVGAVALADMFLETYDSKYGDIAIGPAEAKHDVRESFVLRVLQSNREHIKDQALLDIVDQLIRVLQKTTK